MALFSFFKTSKNQKFLYIPQYWDPDEEKKKERKEYLESLKDNSPEAVKERLSKGGFKRGYASNPQFRKKKVLQSNMMLLGILVVLIALVIYFLSYYLPKIIEALEGTGTEQIIQ